MTTFYHRELKHDAMAERGEVTVTDDGRDYRYDISGDERADFLAWATDVFTGRSSNCKTLEGEWPFLEVRQPG